MKKMAQLITLDRAYTMWLELLYKCKKHIWDKDKMTFGDYIDQLKDLGFRII